MFKKIADSKFGTFIIPWIIFIILKALEYTSRKNVTIHPDSEDLMKGDKPFVAVMFHSRLLMMHLLLPKGLKFGVLNSPHRDGFLIGKAINKLGITNFFGSSTRDGTKILMEMKTWISEGNSVGITVDGPRGPAYKSKPGAIFLAKELQVPILPMAYSLKKGHFRDTWDCFLQPALFDSYEFEVGAPIYLDSDIQIRDTLKLIDAKILEVTNSVDIRCAKETPTPSKEKAEKALRREKRLKAEQREKDKAFKESQQNTNDNNNNES